MSENHEEFMLTRRQLLLAAGGVTFSALLPSTNGTFAAVFESPRKTALAPKFTALPYLQAGPKGSKMVDGKESIVIAWQTDGVPATFTVEYGQNKYDKKATVEKKLRKAADQPGDQIVNHTVTLEGLHLNKRYQYRVLMDGEKLLEGYFTTRKPRGTQTRFVTFGDNSCGDPSDHAIAYYSYKAMPDFVMNTGDNVYNHGLDSEYARHFFPIYNSDNAGPKTGAPLLRSVPFYVVMGNHDLSGNDPRNQPVVDFTHHSDGYGYFTNMHLPLNGPTPTHAPLAIGDSTAVEQFKSSAGDRYPNMANYSYDYGDVHFLCLDSNLYLDPTDKDLQAWIEKDLKATNAKWKIAVYHHPAFNVGGEHYEEQHMRVLSPLLERLGVDVVLNGHEHNYQRTQPLRFVPTDLKGALDLGKGKRLVPGNFTVDRKFDGVTVTKPDGIIHIVTGAGGNDLYDPKANNNPSEWTHAEDNNVEYVAKMITDRHSLTVVDVDSKSLSFTQIDEEGKEIDRFRITKS